MAYNTGISRTGTYGGGSGSDPLVPEPVSDQIIQELVKESVLLNRAKHVTMSSKTQRMPVLDVLPTAYFVSGDTGLEQSATQQWKNVMLVAEELAVIVPVPNAYLDDADVPIWNEVRPRLVEALGRTIDAAGLFGVSIPSTWGSSIYTAAVAAGNTVPASAAEDPGVTVAKIGQQLSKQGFNINGFATRPGYTWKLVGMRSTGATQVPIFQQDMQSPASGLLYGYPLNEVHNGAWQSGTDMIAGDWTKVMLGLRRDINFKIFEEGVITDNTGAIIQNLMQTDSVALRVTMRVGFATANPVTNDQPNDSLRYPFSVLQNTSGS